MNQRAFFQEANGRAVPQEFWHTLGIGSDRAGDKEHQTEHRNTVSLWAPQLETHAVRAISRASPPTTFANKQDSKVSHDQWNMSW